MSYGNSLQTRLGFNFDLNKLAGAIDPNGNLAASLSAQANILNKNTSTRYSALATGNINLATYYSNPVSSICSLLNSSITSIYNNLYNYANGEDFPLRSLVDSYSTLVTDLQRELSEDDDNLNGTAKAYNTFISHTNRLSNLKVSNASTRPSFSRASGLTQTIQNLVYQLETTSTQTVGSLAFGSFTSLFIISDLTSYYNSINNALSSINSYIATNPVTPNQSITDIVDAVVIDWTNLYSLITTRRTHDETFFQNANSIVEDLSKIQSNTLFANTTTELSGYLIQNVIGTNNLKSLL